MHLVVDACAVRRGSTAIVIANVLQGWVQAAPQDTITVLVDRAPEFPVPVGADVQRLSGPTKGVVSRLWTQSIGIRMACHRLEADALLSAVPASAFLGARCPHGVIVYDVRHELRPAQFSRLRRLVRRVSYGWTFHRADALLCISNRTRTDVLARRPRLTAKTHAVPLGSDHAAGWRAAGASGVEPYALAFGHFANKNVDRVLQAWRTYSDDTPDASLHICGLGTGARVDAERLVAELGIEKRVVLLPWLSDVDFESEFAGASAVLFPSDFEGFGLPAVEAMLLGIPVVVSDDPALREVTGGHAIVAASDSADSLATAIELAFARSADDLAAAQERAREFTWAGNAARSREILLARGLSG